MLENLSELIRDCQRRAEEAAQMAKRQTNPQARADFREMEQRWLRLARSYEFTEQLTRFISGRGSKQSQPPPHTDNP